MTEEELRRLAELINAGQGLKLGDAALAALIAGVVSFFLNWLNNRSQRLSKEDEHRRKRREWFLEKQARDAEEIISVLEGYTKELGDSLKRENFLFNDVTLVIEGKRKMGSPGWKDLQVQAKVTNELRVEIFRSSIQQRSWANYDAVRLTVWLERPTHHKEKLDDLLLQCFEVNEDLSHMMGLLSHIYKGFESGDFTETRFFLLAQEIHERNYELWQKVSEDIANFQRELIESLREG